MNENIKSQLVNYLLESTELFFKLYESSDDELEKIANNISEENLNFIQENILTEDFMDFISEIKNQYNILLESENTLSIENLFESVVEGYFSNTLDEAIVNAIGRGIFKGFANAVIGTGKFVRRTAVAGAYKPVMGKIQRKFATNNQEQILNKAKNNEERSKMTKSLDAFTKNKTKLNYINDKLRSKQGTQFRTLAATGNKFEKKLAKKEIKGLKKLAKQEYKMDKKEGKQLTKKAMSDSGVASGAWGKSKEVLDKHDERKLQKKKESMRPASQEKIKKQIEIEKDKAEFARAMKEGKPKNTDINPYKDERQDFAPVGVDPKDLDRAGNKNPIIKTDALTSKTKKNKTSSTTKKSVEKTSTPKKPVEKQPIKESTNTILQEKPWNVKGEYVPDSEVQIGSKKFTGKGDYVAKTNKGETVIGSDNKKQDAKIGKDLNGETSKSKLRRLTKSVSNATKTATELDQKDREDIFRKKENQADVKKMKDDAQKKVDKIKQLKEEVVLLEGLIAKLKERKERKKIEKEQKKVSDMEKIAKAKGFDSVEEYMTYLNSNKTDKQEKKEIKKLKKKEA